MWQVFPLASKILKYPAAVPVPAAASPVPRQSLAIAIPPSLGVASQGEGNLISHNRVPVEASVQSPGGAPENNRNTAPSPTTPLFSATAPLNKLNVALRNAMP